MLLELLAEFVTGKFSSKFHWDDVIFFPIKYLGQKEAKQQPFFFKCLFQS